MLIPKIIRTSWKTKDIIDFDHPLIEHGIRSLVKLNPDWKFEIHDDDEVNEYLKSMLDASDYEALSNRHIVEKTDVWRLVKLYMEGGIYVDLDRLHDIPLSKAIPVNCMWVIPTCRDYDFSHDIMITAPNNPVFLETLKLNLHRRKLGYTNVYSLGAQTYMHAITNFFVHWKVNTNPKLELFNYIRKNINSSEFAMTIREDIPIETITFRNSIGITQEQHEEMKRDMYKKTDVKHWTNEW